MSRLVDLAAAVMSRSVDWAVGAEMLDGSTWMPEPSRIDGSTWLLELKSKRVDCHQSRLVWMHQLGHKR